MKMLTLCFATLAMGTATMAQENAIPDYSRTPRAQVPAGYTWKISDIYPDTKAWEQDLALWNQGIEALGARCATWTESAAQMKAFQDELSRLQVLGERLYSYAARLHDTDLGVAAYAAMQSRVRDGFVRLGSTLAGMNADILKLGADGFSAFLKTEPGLQPYAHGVDAVLRLKEHVLPAEQQRIVSLTGGFTNAPSRAANMLNDVEIPPATLELEGKDPVVLNQAAYVRLRGDRDPALRQKVMQTYWASRKPFEKTLALLLEGEIRQHLFSAQVHGYPDALTSALFPRALTPEVYRRTIEQVRQNLAPLHRYLALKKKLLKLDTFRYEDIYASAVNARDWSFPYPQAQEFILSALKPLGKDYQKLLHQAFSQGWIDLYPNLGKQTGAYSSGLYGVHPFIKMNFDGQYGSVSTLAHELGHAMHSQLSDTHLHPAQADYPIFLAEIASTFNEHLLTRHLLKQEKDPLFRLFLLDRYMEQCRGTIYRQCLFAEFEWLMHQRAEAGEALSADWLNETYLRLTREYYGHDQGVVAVGDFIANEWSGIPHFFMDHYVISYTTGMIASLALSEKVLTEGRPARDAYLGMLSSGGSDYPLILLRKAGVDMEADGTYTKAFTFLSHLMDEMEELAARQGSGS